MTGPACVTGWIGGRSAGFTANQPLAGGVGLSACVEGLQDVCACLNVRTNVLRSCGVQSLSWASAVIGNRMCVDGGYAYVHGVRHCVSVYFNPESIQE